MDGGRGNLDGSQRLSIFLIPLSESEGTDEANGNQQQNPDYQYVVAVNGIVDHRTSLYLLISWKTMLASITQMSLHKSIFLSVLLM